MTDTGDRPEPDAILAGLLEDDRLQEVREHCLLALRHVERLDEALAALDQDPAAPSSDTLRREALRDIHGFLRLARQVSLLLSPSGPDGGEKALESDVKAPGEPT